MSPLSTTRRQCNDHEAPILLARSSPPHAAADAVQPAGASDSVADGLTALLAESIRCAWPPASERAPRSRGQRVILMKVRMS
jgi:hypothetical protein